MSLLDQFTTVELHKEGILLTRQQHTQFLHFPTEPIENKFNITNDTTNLDEPMYTIQLPLIIGILKIQFGYLICVSEIDTPVSIANLQINKVTGSVLIPLQFDTALEWFQNWINDDLPRSKSSLSTSNTRTSLHTVEEPATIATKNIEDILFTNVGILTQSIKSTPLLGLNNYQKITDPSVDENELFDVNRDLSDTEESNESIKLDNRNVSNSIKSVNYNHISPVFIKRILKNVLSYFDRSGFYFSYDINIFGPLQYSNGHFSPLLVDTISDFKDCNFFWNKDLLTDFTKVHQDGDSLIAIPMIQGFVDSIEINNIMTQDEFNAMEKPESVKPKAFDFTSEWNKFTTDFKTAFNIPLEEAVTEPAKTKDNGNHGTILMISKRSNKRCGVRYLRRGIDDDGNVANFVQTSQMFIYEDIFTNYDVIRGSIPLFFEQDPSKLQPEPRLTRSVAQCEELLVRHYANLNRHYHDVTTVSLVEKKKREKNIGQTFEKLVVDNGLKFTWFDFHDICSNMKFENINYLLEYQVSNTNNTVLQQLEEYKWYSTDQTQRGIFRINCIDCLDRTNIICKFLNEKILNKQLDQLQLQILDPSFEYKFSNLWANNGDTISQQYCSTNAMKGDFTRTNKRNYKGLFNDAILSLTRYYYNSVTDFFNQFIIDYLLYHNKNDVNFLENFESLMDNFDPNSHNSQNLQRKLIMTNILKIFAQEQVMGSWWVKSSFSLNKYKRDQFSLQLPKNELLDCILIISKEHMLLTYVDLDNNKLTYYKIPSDSVSVLQYGHFFSSIYTSNDKSPQKNIGLKIEFNKYTKFTNSIVTDFTDDTLTMTLAENDLKQELSNEITTTTTNSHVKFLAIKFDNLPYTDCQKAIRLISKICYRAQLSKEDLVNFEDAKKTSSIVGNIDHQVKKFIWG